MQSLQKELVGKSYKFTQPGIDSDAPGGPAMDVFDPFSNTIRFCQTMSPEADRSAHCGTAALLRPTSTNLWLG